MIAHLTGTILDTHDDSVILHANGVGYRVYVSPTTLANLRVQMDAELWIHTAVREDTLDLYGFENKDQLAFFEKLIGVSGIGPKSALDIISLAPTEKIVAAITEEDTDYLTEVSGVGTKTAQKVVLELKNDLQDIHADASATTKESRHAENEAIEALKSLGYSTTAARDALADIDDDIEDTSAKVKAALQNIDN